MKCSRCPVESIPAHFTVVGDERLCPSCMYADYEKAMRSPGPAVNAGAPPKVPMPPASGFKVIDLPTTRSRRKK